MCDHAYRARRQNPSAKAFGPQRRIAFHREIERRFTGIRGGDGVRGGLAISRNPARHQPFRRVEIGRIEFRQPCGAFAREPAQHGIDQARISRGVAVRLHQADGKIDRRMIGHVEEQDLCGADQQRRLHARHLLRRTAFEQEAEEMAQGAEAPQDDGD